MEFETLEEMVEFYEANKDDYALIWGTSVRLYRRREDGLPGQLTDLVAEYDDDRAPDMTLYGLKEVVLGGIDRSD